MNIHLHDITGEWRKHSIKDRIPTVEERGPVVASLTAEELKQYATLAHHYQQFAMPSLPSINFSGRVAGRPTALLLRQSFC